MGGRLRAVLPRTLRLVAVRSVCRPIVPRASRVRVPDASGADAVERPRPAIPGSAVPRRPAARRFVGALE
jgi:hypothetical protein